MRHQNERLAYAREILAGVEQKLGISRLDITSVAGQVYCAEGSVGRVLVAASHALMQGQWVAAVGLPQAGWGAAAYRGTPMDRLVLIPDERGKAELVIHHLLPHVDMLLVGDVPLARAQQQRLAARVRKYQSTVVTIRPWPGVSRALDPAASLTALRANGSVEHTHGISIGKVASL